MDQPKTVVKSALQFFFGTLLSRFSGFFREMALGAWFGATPLMAAFFIAYRFSQLLRRLFGESSLLSSFSPHFEALRAESPEKGKAFFRDLFASLSTILLLVVLTLEVILFYVWKWSGVSQDTAQILFLTMVMLPGVIFVCLYALFSALLQSEKKYFLPSSAPVLFNIIFIVAMWFVKDLPHETAAAWLALGVVLAFFVQWMIVLPPASSFLRGIQWFKARLFAPELRQMVSAMTYTIVGIGAVQINSMIDALFARYADLSGPAYLYFANRLYQLPLALFGLALSSALLPPLARSLQQKDLNRYRQLLQFSLTRSFGFILPVTLALFILGDTVVNLIYGRGAFDSTAVSQTTSCLWGYTIGLAPAVFVLLLAPAFYAQKDFKTPLYASLISVGVNILLNALLIFALDGGSASIAIATSLATFVNFFFLWFKLSKKTDIKLPLTSFSKVGLCAILATLFTGAIRYFLISTDLPRALFPQILQLFVLGGIFSLLYFSYAWMLNVQEAFQFLGLKKTLSEEI